MGKYRSTLNMPGARRGQVAEFPDDSKRTLALVRDGHLIPVEVSEEVRQRLLEEKKNAPTRRANDSDIEAVKAALAARRAAAAEGTPVPAVEEVSTAVTNEDPSPDEKGEPRAEVEGPSIEVESKPEPEVEASEKRPTSRTGTRKRGA